MRLKKYLLIPLYLLVFQPLVYSQTQDVQLDITFDSLPFEISRPFITTQIQNKEIKMLFDTGFGAADIGLSKEVLNSISVQWIADKTCSEDAFGNKKCFDTFQIKELKLGSLTLKNLKGVLLDAETLNSMFGDEDNAQVGVLGLPLISQFEVLLNYPQNKIILNTEHLLSKDGLTEHARLAFNRLAFKGTNIIQTNLPVNGHQATLVWDTGAISILSAQFGADLEKKVCPIILDESMQCVENDFLSTIMPPIQKSWFYLMPLPDELKIDGFIGSQYFHHYPVKINFTKYEIALYK